MKLLLFSDLHANEDAARRLAIRAWRFDVLVGAGDFADMHQGLEVCLPLLLKTERPMVLVAGNNETTEALTAACAGHPEVYVLHGTGARIGGTTFWGLGGGVPVTPFGPWSYDFTEEQAAELLAPMPSGAVLVTHSPPKGLLDVSSRGVSLGSTAVRTAVDSKHPRLIVCGHIHASSRERMEHGPTTVINAGPDGMEWEG